MGSKLISENIVCRVCGASRLTSILSLGEQCVTNFVDNLSADVNKAPLDLVLCDPENGGCGLLQLKHTFDHDVLYRKYWYRSGMSTTMKNALADITDAAENTLRLQKEDIVVDIGANDGTLLESYKTSGLVRVGFEPSNLWEDGAKKSGLRMVHNYFTYESYKNEFDDKKARVITSIAMFYDLEQPNRFVEDIKRVLDREGLWIIQMNYLGLMIDNNTFDNISHEHLEYYSLQSLEYLLNKHGLEAFDVELNDVNGGSYRIYIRNNGSNVTYREGGEKRLDDLRAKEKSSGYDKKKIYEEFAKRIVKSRNALVDFIKTEVKNGKKIFVYGASTRGLVVLQYADITNKLIEAATDKSPEKWGKYIVGTGIPIISIEEYRKRNPDYLFVLPYHFIKEIYNQEIEFINNGGKMFVAIPELKIYDKKSGL